MNELIHTQDRGFAIVGDGYAGAMPLPDPYATSYIAKLDAAGAG